MFKQKGVYTASGSHIEHYISNELQKLDEAAKVALYSLRTLFEMLVMKLFISNCVGHDF